MRADVAVATPAVAVDESMLFLELVANIVITMIKNKVVAIVIIFFTPFSVTRAMTIAHIISDFAPKIKNSLSMFCAFCHATMGLWFRLFYLIDKIVLKKEVLWTR